MVKRSLPFRVLTFVFSMLLAFCLGFNAIASMYGDVINDVRDSNEIIYSSLKKLPLYANLHTTKIDTSNKSIDQIVREIKRL